MLGHGPAPQLMKARSQDGAVPLPASCSPCLPLSGCSGAVPTTSCPSAEEPDVVSWAGRGQRAHVLPADTLSLHVSLLSTAYPVARARQATAPSGLRDSHTVSSWAMREALQRPTASRPPQPPPGSPGWVSCHHSHPALAGWAKVAHGLPGGEGLAGLICAHRIFSGMSWAALSGPRKRPSWAGHEVSHDPPWPTYPVWLTPSVQREPPKGS